MDFETLIKIAENHKKEVIEFTEVAKEFESNKKVLQDALSECRKEKLFEGLEVDKTEKIERICDCLNDLYEKLEEIIF